MARKSPNLTQLDGYKKLGHQVVNFQYLCCYGHIGLHEMGKNNGKRGQGPINIFEILLPIVDGRLVECKVTEEVGVVMFSSAWPYIMFFCGHTAWFCVVNKHGFLWQTEWFCGIRKHGFVRSTSMVFCGMTAWFYDMSIW